MKKIAIVLTIVVVLSVVNLRNQIKRATEELDYGIAPGFKLTGFTFGNSKLLVPFWVNNPTNFNLTISGLQLDVFVNNTFAGRITLSKAYELKKLSRSVIPFEVTLDNVMAMNILINVNQYIQNDNWRDKIVISLRGSARLESGFIYLSNVPIVADGSYKYWMG